MTETVRIMPKQPFEVALGNGRYWPTAETQRRATYFPAEHWHEVSDPIVWDGTDEAFKAIRAAFEGTANYASRDDNPSAGWGHSGCLWVGVGQQSSLVPPGWRIQAIGGSFVILPPEVTP